MKRLDYIDFLKGFAIFLVVMGHFLSWQWGGSLNSKMPLDIKYVNIVAKFIYSFHMPLFFFISGYCFNRSMKIWSVNDLVNVIIRRIKQLIVPGLTAMVICYYVYDKIYFEWFLRTLFEIFTINAAIYYVCQRWKNRVVIEILFQITAYILCRIFSRLAVDTVIGNILEIRSVSDNMPYFYFGILCFRFNFLAYLKKHDIFIGLALILWIATFVLKQNGLDFHGFGYFTAICAIIVCVYFAESFDYTKKSIILNFFIKLGLYTLPIYILSPYFIPRGEILGRWIQFFAMDSFETAVLSQLLIGGFVSVISIIIVYGVARILEKSCLTKLLFLGK